MTILLIIAAQAAVSLPAAVSFDLADMPGARPSLQVRRTCDPATDADAITVCADRRDFRLPLPVERAATDRDAHLAGDMPSAVAAFTPRRRCGIFAGERRCSKAEARRYGYGGGRDPVTLLTRLGTRLLDPDAK